MIKKIIANSSSKAVATTSLALASLLSTPVTHGAAIDAKAVSADVTYPNYRFKSGQVLDSLRLHYRTLGTPHRNAKGDIDNAVLVLHWTANSGAQVMTPEYIEALYGPGKPLDANRYYLIIPDNVGHGQSSKPSDGLLARFPNYGYQDIVDLQHKLVTETLGIHKLHAILGMSMGGMNAWQWAVEYPDAVKGIMPVVSFPTSISGRNLLWRTIVTNGIRNDPTWHGGQYAKQPDSFRDGYLILRMMIDSVPRLQSQVSDLASANQWIDTAGKESTNADANNVLYSLESSRDYNPEPKLGSIKAKVFALNFDDDEFNPNQLQTLQTLMKQVPNGSYVVQKGTDSSPGHLTMAKPSLWADHVKNFMQSLD